MKAIIIGSGPAGISAALYTRRANIETIIISKDSGSLGKTDKINNYYGHPDPISGEELYKNGIDQAKSIGVEFVDAEVVGIGFLNGYVVQTTYGDYSADGVIIAMGSTRNTPKIKGLSKFEGKGVSYCAVCDAFFFREKNVAVLGSGEYALHEISELLPVVGSVTLLTNGGIPSTDFLVPVMTDKISEISGADTVEKIIFENGKSFDIDGVFVAYGTAGSSEIARKLGVLIENGKIVTDENMSCGLPGLYAAGDCTGGLLQIAKAVYEGATAGTQLIKYFRSIRKE